MTTTRRRNLAAAFAPTEERPSRTAGLGDLLPLRAGDQATSQPEQPVARTAEAAEGAVRSPATSGLRGVAVYLDEDTVTWLRSTATSSGGTYSEVVLDAFERQAGQFDALLADPAPQQPAGALFRPRRRRTTAGPKPKVQVQLRLTADELAVIDNLVEKHRAPSRTALVSAVLRAAASA